MAIDLSLLRELGVKADCDPRTIAKALRGEPVRGMAGRRARAALKRAGFDVPDPAQGPRQAKASGGTP